MDQLPEELRKVTVFLHGEELEAQVVNASRSGFGFRLQAPVTDLVRGIPIALRFLALNRRLTGTVAFLERETEGSCRVGVRLEDSLAQEDYLRLIDRLG